MKDSKGMPIYISDILKSSQSENCIPVIQMISEGKFIHLFDFERKPFLINQQSMSNSKWIVVKESRKAFEKKGEKRESTKQYQR